MSYPAVILVTPWYGHFAGGAEVAARRLAENLARRGITVDVLTTCCRSPYESWWEDALPRGSERINGVTVHRFPVDGDGADRYHEVCHRQIHGLPITEAQQGQFVRHSINSKALVRHAAALSDASVMITLPYTQGLIHSLVEALPNRVLLMPCLHDEAQAGWLTTQQLLLGARRVLFLTEQEKTLAIRLFGAVLGRRVVESPVIGIGVDMPPAIRDALTNRDTLQSVRHRYRLPDTFWVCLGRKEIAKNIAQLIRYFSTFCAAGGKAQLVFLGGGDGTLVPRHDGVLDLGVVAEEDKHLILSQALGLIHLSERESFCLALMEAWLCGKPAIVSAGCAVTASHCRRSGGGLPVASADEFVVALQTMEDAELRRTLGAAGRRYVEASYSWDHVLDRFFRALAYA